MHPRLRWQLGLLLVLVVAVVTGGLVVSWVFWPAASDAPTDNPTDVPTEEPTDEPTDGQRADQAPAARRPLTEFLQMPGDQIVVVPDGTYVGGEVRAEHPETDGAFGGWLVLVAESRGGVVVDLSEEELELEPGTSRVMFVGFAFENGRVRNHGDRIRYWYTTHTFPYDAWVEAGGPDGVHERPKTMLIAEATNVGIHGATFSDVGDDGINVWKSRDVVIEGSTFTDIANRGHNDLIHADAIQVQGDVRRMAVRQSVIERQHVGTEVNGDVVKLTWENCWFRDSRGAGITFAADGGNKISGRRTNVRSFGHSNGKDRIDFVDGKRDRVDVDDKGVVTRRPPRGTRSPANAWRVQHPYDSWATTLRQ